MSDWDWTLGYLLGLGMGALFRLTPGPYAAICVGLVALNMAMDHVRLVLQ